MNAKSEYAALPTNLRRYVGGVAAAGTFVALAQLAIRPHALDERSWLIVATLTGFASLAEASPLHLTHKTNINVASAFYLAMLMLVPWQLAGFLALASAGIGQAWR